METLKPKTPKKLLGLLAGVVVLILLVAVFTISSYTKSAAKKENAKIVAAKVVADKKTADKKTADAKIVADQAAAAEQKKQAEAATAAAAVTAEATATSGPISDDLYKYEVSIDGIKYALPASYSDFEKNGWIGKDFGTKTMDPNKYNIVNLEKGDQTMMVSIANMGTDVLPLSKCYIGRITIETINKNQKTNILMSKGISLTSSQEEVIAAYGNPSDKYEGTTTTKLTYKSGSYSECEITFDKTTKMVYSIKLENLVKPANQETTAAVDTGLPAVVKNYKAPTSLGDDLYAFQVKYAGSLYKLPVPIAELVKNGWVLQSNGDKLVAAKSSAFGIELRKDNQILRTQIANYSEKGEPIKNCFATYVQYYNNGAMLPIELPKGITEKSTIEQVIAAYGKPTKEDTSSSYKYYTYGKVFQKTTFTTKDGKIVKIEVDYAPKELN
ncbi:hypothetical protein [Clostridium lacusfryxellense]|uniref:hypothetical protein n=1 Tax=Clostridium lacusfryxellense TaxID=205328 RepID=UPI001C0D3F9F|nr:hypothetical protein [Clostridium lacusfryxellense]MBU3109980.1 hypothetical protein [Clostridium lacusfryxellense]